MSNTFSLAGEASKFTEVDDIEPKLKNLPSSDSAVHTIILSGNTFGPNATEYFASRLKQQSKLHTAIFSDIFTGRLISEIPLAVTSICNTLSDLPVLTHVDLSDNAFGGRSALPLVPLITKCQSLREFRLQNNGLGITGGRIVAQAFIDLANSCKEQGVKPNIKKIAIGRNRLENESCELFEQAFALLGSLEEVRMPQNGIKREGIQMLMAGLAHCRNLSVVDIEDNTSSLAGARAIARVLPLWSEISEINVSDCLLTRRGSELIISALCTGKNPKLKELKIQYAGITGAMFEKLAKGIKEHMPLLKNVEINGNRCNEDSEELETLRTAMGDGGELGELDEMDEDEESDEEESDDGPEETASVETSKISDEEAEDELTKAISSVKI